MDRDLVGRKSQDSATDGQRDKGWFLAFWLEHLAGWFAAEHGDFHTPARHPRGAAHRVAGGGKGPWRECRGKRPGPKPREDRVDTAFSGAGEGAAKEGAAKAPEGGLLISQDVNGPTDEAG